MNHPSTLNRAPLIAALAAGLAALPGLWLPFLSDDWALLATLRQGPVLTTPYGDFRPLFLASLWLDRLLWGASPAVFHLTNLLLLGSTAWLLVLVVRVFSGLPQLAAWAGLLYALHPWHVENAAWVSARTEPLFTACLLGAALTHERWLKFARGLPALTMLMFQAALMSKETALIFPLFITAWAGLRPANASGRPPWMRAYGVLWLQAGVHLIVRTAVLGGAGRTLLEGPWWSGPLNLAAYATASLLPLPAEWLIAFPWLWGSLAVAVLTLLLCLVGRAGKPSLSVPVMAGTAFIILALPSLVGLQERYFLLPSMASAVVLAALLQRMPGRRRLIATTLILGVWGSLLVVHWQNWSEAGTASRQLVRDLSRLSHLAPEQDILVVNMPFQVRGGSVAGDLSAALPMNSGRPVRVRAATFISYASAVGGDVQVLADRDDGQMAFRIHRLAGVYNRLVGPVPSPGDTTLRTPLAVLSREPSGSLLIRPRQHDEAPWRLAVWQDGRLQGVAPQP